MNKTIQLLIADDSPADSDLVVRALRKHGLNVIWQRVDTEADFIAALRPDVELVIADYSMPGFNGLRALALVRARSERLPFILVSGTLGEEAAVTAMRMGASDYLLKDRLTRLGSAVEHLLAEAELRKERTAALAAQRESEEKFQTLVALSPDAVVIQQDGRIAYINRRGMELCGATEAAEVLGKSLSEFFIPADQPAAAAQFVRQEAGDAAPEVQELAILRRDGIIVSVEVSAVRFQHAGAPALQVVIHDVSQRRIAEAAREKERRRVALLADISGRLVLHETPSESLGGIFAELAHELNVDIFASYIVSPTGDTLILESSGGLTPEQRQAFAVLPFGVSLCGVVAERRVRLILEELSSNESQAVGIAALGVKAYAGHPLIAGGRLIGTASFGRKQEAFSEDELRLMTAVTDQVSAALERTRLLRDLRAQQERFREVVENIREVFWMTDPAKSEVIYISTAYETIWGRTCESARRAPRTWIDAIHPEDRGRILEAAKTKQAAGTYDETYRIIRPDGTQRWIQDKAFPVRAADGTVLRVVGVAEDITDRKVLEERYLKAQRLEAVGQLASGIAHDLNNLLSPVMMVPSFLRGKTTDPRDLELLGIVENAGTRGASIIRQLLTFSRGYAGARNTVNLRQLMREMASIARETFPRLISVEDYIPPDLWSIIADGTQIHQILMNLCVNARDAMPGGGRLTLSAQNIELTPADVAAHPGVQPGRFVRFEVSDTGAGMAPEILQRIFEPYFTTKEEGKGTGLGLSIVLGIVGSHHGFIVANSRPGEGTTFTVHLPAAAVPVTDIRDTVGSNAPLGRGEGILLVDDEESIRITYRVFLERQGFRVFPARNGQHALGTFSEHRDTIRLAVIDLMMPVMDGLSAVRLLRETAPDLEIVVMTGVLYPECRAELTAQGVKHFLMKPFPPDDMAQTIFDALKGRR